MPNITITHSGATTIIRSDSTPISFTTSAATVTAVDDTTISIVVGGTPIITMDINDITSIDGAKPYGNASDIVTQITNASSPSGGAGVTNITYAQLQTAIAGSTLTAGAQYKITDFATKHYIVDAAGTQYATIITGATEPLIVTAISTNQIDKVAKSTLYPQDIIHYDWDASNWLTDKSFADTGVIVTGWKGAILYREDTLLQNRFGYDFRHCKFRRWKTDAPAWSDATTYSYQDVVVLGTVVYVSLRGSNLNNEPSDASAWWVRMLDLSLTEYWNNRPDAQNGVPSDSEFDDFLTFVADGAFDYEALVSANEFDSTYPIDGFSLLPNNVFFLREYAIVQNNKVQGQCTGNTICFGFWGNIMGYSSYNNQITGVFDCGLGNFFRSNAVFAGLSDTTFFSYTLGNIFGSGFNDANVIGPGFQTNYIVGEFGDNTVGGHVSDFSITDEVKGKTFSSLLSGTGIDLSAATHLYADYSCTVLKNNAGALKLQYLDGTTVTIVDVDA